MNINILCVGKLKESYWREAAAEYSKRLGKYCRLTVIERKEAPLADNASPAEENQVKEAEGLALLAAVRDGDYVVALDVKGESLDSPGLAALLEGLALSGKSNLCFIIGGSLGLSPAVLARADRRLSFSALTFPHQLMRVILLEQLYRGFKISRRETYHK